MQFPLQRAKPRLGCLGNLTRLILVVAGVGVLLLLATAVFAPWGFFLGGKFHLLPYWQGWGRLHSRISGDYVVYVRLQPGTGSRLSTALDGEGYICTPRGERIRLTLSGGMRRHLNLSTDREAITLSMHHRPTFSGETRPRIELRGRWQNPNLVMNDDGSISRSFEPDGSVYLGHDPSRPYRLEVVSITLTEGSYSQFESACAAILQR
ncbi:MAG TPA: hypothetical protein VLR94_01760 [Acidobacteriota bacterium]|nr:hypothetical protein [Acidobacteriota bacterium]